MKDRDLQKIADELDSQDMIGFTRNFIDDFEAFFNSPCRI